MKASFCQLLIGVMGWTGAVNAAAVEKLVLCHEEEDSYPWILKERQGLDMILLAMVAKKLNLQFEMKPLPWVRCLYELRHNQVDGAFKLSFSQERLKMARYPMRGDGPDIQQRLHSDSYSLYQKKSGPVSWDGQKLTYPRGMFIGAQTGFTIITQLKELGVQVDDQTRSAELNFRKLLAGRVVAVALHTQEGDMELANMPEAINKIEKIIPPLIEKNYYLVFADNFYNKQPKRAKQIWLSIAQTRESAAFKKTAAKFK